MARAYICLTRNDLGDSLLQVLDLVPNVSQRNSVIDPQGQSCYVSDFVQNDTVATTGAGPKTTNAAYYGLAAYLLDNVEDTPNNIAITAAKANAIAAAILGALAAGSALTSAAINALVQAEVAGSGVGLGDSRATVEGILKVLSGRCYKLPSGSTVAGNGNAFPGTASGFFTTAPVVQKNAVRGRSATSPVSTTPATQTGTHDLAHRALRDLVDTPDLHRSCLNGALSHLKASSYSFRNPAFTYVASTGTAKNVAGTSLSSPAARAVVVYAADGTVI